jgi:hypothetical protein
MKHLPRDLRTEPEPTEDDELWSETLSALALFGAVLLLVFVISAVGRL